VSAAIQLVNLPMQKKPSHKAATGSPQVTAHEETELSVVSKPCTRSPIGRARALIGINCLKTQRCISRAFATRSPSRSAARDSRTRWRIAFSSTERAGNTRMALSRVVENHIREEELTRIGLRNQI